MRYVFFSALFLTQLILPSIGLLQIHEVGSMSPYSIPEKSLFLSLYSSLFYCMWQLAFLFEELFAHSVAFSVLQ